jgi:FtsP/CotA-like multicopper oxidase with cupredoxin domain
VSPADVSPTGVSPTGWRAVELPTQVQETLTVRFADLDGKKRMMYEGATSPPRIPGPTLRVARGETGGQIELLLRNHLDLEELDVTIDAGLIEDLTIEDPGPCTAHGPTVSSFGRMITNLHTHGLHVQPDKAASGELADNIFVALMPKGETEAPDCEGHGPIDWHFGEAAYRFDIRPDHPPGTFWYHAHKHGAVAYQLQQGLFGALIIGEEERDGIPDYISQATEHVIFFTNQRDNNGDVWRNEEGLNLAQNPITIQPGEVQRWRMINASPEAVDHIGLEIVTPNIEMYLIAFDGLMLSERRLVTPDDFSADLDHQDADKDWAVIAPGNRADFLVRVAPDAPAGLVGIRTFAFENGPQRRDEATFRIVQVGNEPMNSLWDDDPKLAPPHLPDLMTATVDYHRKVEFGKPADNVFTIDGTPYTGEPLAPPMRLNTVEEWELKVVDASPGGQFLIHPFHIHVNPFYVTHHNGEPLPPYHPRRRWQDTIAIPPRGSITFRTRFDNFTGDFVIHCHNLRHEDRGMMHRVQVVDGSAVDPDNDAAVATGEHGATTTHQH